MAVGIYKLCWDNCGYFYYGQSKNLYNRRKDHLGGLLSGKHGNEKLVNVFKKYGLPKFKILIYCESEDLNFYEQLLLDYGKENRKCCNNCFSATVAFLSEATKKKLSVAMTGKKHPIEQNKKHSQFMKGKRTGNKHPMYGRINPFAGKKHDCKTRKIMSEKSNKFGANNGRAKLVINLETGIFYDCVIDAAKAHCIPATNIYKLLYKGKTSLKLA